MPNDLVNGVAAPKSEVGQIYAIAPGIVTNNLDLTGEGRVQVRVPSRPSFSPWARLGAVGGGSGRGFLWVPQRDDEVLVAFNQNDVKDAYIIGGLWSTKDRPPVSLPPEFMSKRVIKTGMAGGLGHEIVFDDLMQSITITSSTKQKVTIEPLKIEMSNMAGTVKITLDNAQQAISVQAVTSIDLNAAQINLNGKVAVNINSKMTTIGGGLVNIG
jgi:uncharacterized protein involved in type VI secretion and phage assembly